MRFALDENIEPSPRDLDNPQVIQFDKIARKGTPDNIVLERVKERNLIIITQDIRMVLNAAMKNLDIVYQNQNGERYFIYGSMSRVIAKDCCKTKYEGSGKSSKVKLLAQYQGLNLSYNGISSLSFF